MSLNFTAPPYPDDAPELDHPFAIEEVAKALLDLDVNKGPDPDGITVSFLKRSSVNLGSTVDYDLQRFSRQRSFPNRMENCTRGRCAQIGAAVKGQELSADLHLVVPRKGMI